MFPPPLAERIDQAAATPQALMATITLPISAAHESEPLDGHSEGEFQWPSAGSAAGSHAFRVGFDLDGTIVDMLAVLRREAERLLGAAEMPKPRWDHTANDDASDDSEIAALQLNGRQHLLLWRHISAVPDFWKGLPEIESGIVARIAQTAMRRRWEVIFFTTRPLVAGETTQMQSQRWLEAHGFPLPSVIVVQRSIGQIANALDLDAVVDDRLGNCLDVSAASNAQPILMWYGHPTRMPRGTKRSGVRVATSISEALSLLEELDDLKNAKAPRQVSQEVLR